MKNSKPNFNASSMADIAFLLLIFFLVATTIDQDKGLLNKLPPKEPGESRTYKDRNVLEIRVNADNKLMVEGELLPIHELKHVAQEHIKNNGVLEKYSEKPTMAIISLQNDRGTAYMTYIEVQNELKAAYREIRDQEALRLSANKYTYNALKDCAAAKDDGYEYCLELKNRVKAKYPMIISEAEPVSAR